MRLIRGNDGTLRASVSPWRRAIGWGIWAAGMAALLREVAGWMDWEVVGVVSFASLAAVAWFGTTAQEERQARS